MCPTASQYMHISLGQFFKKEKKEKRRQISTFKRKGVSYCQSVYAHLSWTIFQEGEKKKKKKKHIQKKGCVLLPVSICTSLLDNFSQKSQILEYVIPLQLLPSEQSFFFNIFQFLFWNGLIQPENWWHCFEQKHIGATCKGPKLLDPKRIWASGRKVYWGPTSWRAANTLVS